MTSINKAARNRKQNHDEDVPQRDANICEPQGSPVSAFLKAQVIPILIFLFALFFILTFSNPGLFLNDEWITVNQLHQLDMGTQVIVNEGKYGTFMNGTPSPYFAERHNLLGYTLMLPILSLPALKLFGLFGDQFRIAIVLLWSILPVAMALLIDAYRPTWSRWKGIRWTWGVVVAAFAGFIINLFLYYPWPFTALDAPREAAAVVFTNHLIFAVMTVVIYLTCKIIFEDTRFSIFGTVACISCSSYIFWAANAKDHILVAALVATVILFLVRYIRSHSWRDVAFAFVSIGILAWARPEVGLTILIAAVVVYLWIAMNEGHFRRSNLLESFYALALPFLTVIGAIPLFINNAIVTGNPLVPAFWVYEKQLINGASTGNEVIGNAVLSVPTPSGGLQGFIAVVLNHFSPRLATLPGDIFGILFSPASGNMSLVAISPLIVIALTVLPITWLFHRDCFTSFDKRIILLLVAIGVAVWAAYLRSLPGLNASTGIVPDIRYLVPFYLPAGLLGVYAIRTVTKRGDEQSLMQGTVSCILIGLPLFIGAIVILQPFGGLYAGYTAFFKYSTFVLLALSLCAIYLVSVERISIKVLIAILGLLFAAPFAWQIMMVFLYSIGKFNGYPLWIPLVEDIFNMVIHVKEMNP